MFSSDPISVALVAGKKEGLKLMNRINQY